MSQLAQAAPLILVGAGGCLGRAVLAQLREAVAPPPLVTSRTPGEPLFVDLNADPETWRLPEPPKVAGAALLLAAMTSVEICERAPEHSQRVNVDGLMALARKLDERGYFLVFPSTSQVFDGTTSHASGLPRPDDPTCPLTAYGSQKALAESQLLSEFPQNVAVLRITKVLDPNNWLIRRWSIAFLNALEDKAFVDMRMSPVSEALAAEALLGLAEARRPGVYHLSASSDITYYDAARLGAVTLGANPDLVRAEQYSDRCTGRDVCTPGQTALHVPPGSLPGITAEGCCPAPQEAVRRAFALAGAALVGAKRKVLQPKERP